jgi:hypothetical protein
VASTTACARRSSWGDPQRYHEINEAFHAFEPAPLAAGHALGREAGAQRLELRHRLEHARPFRTGDGTGNDQLTLPS